MDPFYSLLIYDIIGALFFLGRVLEIHMYTLLFSPFSGVLMTNATMMTKMTMTKAMYPPHDSNSNESENGNVLSVLKLYQRDFCEEVF